MPDNKNITAAKTSDQFLDGIDQIRDIIFGEHINTWEKKFKKLDQSIQALSQATEKKISELAEKIESTLNESQNASQTLTQSLENASDEVQNSIEKLKTELKKEIDFLVDNKVDKDSIGEVFIQWGQKVKSK